MSLYGQGSRGGGYLVLAEGDTLYGEVQYIDENSVHRDFYRKIRFTDVSGRRSKFKRSEVTAFRTGNADYESFWLDESPQTTFSFNLRYDIDRRSGDLYFLKVIRRGALSHYEFEWFEQGEALLMSMDLFKRENDLYLVRATQGLLGLKRKALRNYFSDCPELAAQIDQKQLKRADEVAAFYNKHCKR
jgi:hypothetical protein